MRRSFLRTHRSKGGTSYARKYQYYILIACIVTGVIWYLAFVSEFLRRSTGVVEEFSGERGLGCVAWRQTRSCSPYGVRDVGGDQACDFWVTKNSGYCECDDFLTINRVECGPYKAFRCMDACAKLRQNLQEAESLPANVTCTTQGTQDGSFFGAAANWLQSHKSNAHRHHFNNQQIMAIKDMEGQASRLWWSIRSAVEIVEEEGISIPEPRTHARDWVRDGVHMPLDVVEAARKQWHRYMDESPPYPTQMFNGRGIVVLAGGLTYMVPAWINIHMLRRTGCQLPVEMFFPKKEFPTLAMENALMDLGVTCRKLPDLRPEIEKDESEAKPIADTEPSLSGFTMKIAALILSQFKEVVFLDSDNVAVLDPASLFSSELYQKTGALLWPDYWESSAAPDLAKILGGQVLPSTTFESGQMVFDKQRAWAGLLLATFFNMQSDFYYELFSNFMGKGDKESFAHSLQASGVPYSVVPFEVGSIGEFVKQCTPNGACEEVFLGNTMTQFSPEGRVMFLHTNLSPKWNLEIPGNFSHYRRRWKEIVPGRNDFIEEFGDLELEVYQTLVLLTCSPFLPSYIKVLASDERMGEENTLPVGLRGFHPMNPGVEFRQAYRWGLSGPYLRFTKVTFRDNLSHFLNNSLKPRIFYMGRFFYRPISWFTGKPAFFHLW